MVSKEIRKIRANDCITLMPSGFFWTLTTADVVDVFTIRDRWRNFRHELSLHFTRKGKRLQFIQNFEIHPKGHGWHIHFVCDQFIDCRYMLSLAKLYGFGRCNVKPVSTKGISDYLTKHCLKSYKSQCNMPKGSRLRLVNVSRGLPSLSDYFWQCSNQDRVDMVRRKLHYRGYLPSTIGFGKYGYLLRVLPLLDWVDDDDFDLQLAHLW